MSVNDKLTLLKKGTKENKPEYMGLFPEFDCKPSKTEKTFQLVPKTNFAVFAQVVAIKRGANFESGDPNIQLKINFVPSNTSNLYTLVSKSLYNPVLDKMGVFVQHILENTTYVPENPMFCAIFGKKSEDGYFTFDVVFDGVTSQDLLDQLNERKAQEKGI